QSTFVHSSVDLDWMCNFITGGSSACGGNSVRAAFIGIGDCKNIGAGGWVSDAVVVKADVPAACGATPNPVQFFTATAKTNSSPTAYNQLEWQTPASGPCSTVILRRGPGCASPPGA